MTELALIISAIANLVAVVFFWRYARILYSVVRSVEHLTVTQTDQAGTMVDLLEITDETMKEIESIEKRLNALKRPAKPRQKARVTA